jgi:SWI/SNF chromatin-remodeling complex subunit SWI1
MPASSREPTQKPVGQPVRRKIEYVPLARDINTYGGRDLKTFEADLANTTSRAMRDINDWGVVDIEALTMSIRSRLSVELSYALTTLTLLSTMRGPTQGTGFPIMQCMDLFEEILDLLEEVAFQGQTVEDDVQFVTNRELVNTIIDDECRLFAALKVRQGVKDPQLGPNQRPANVILAISNLLRNFSLIFDNAKFMSQHDRVLSILLRLCKARRTEEEILPVSPALSVGDLVVLRKHVLYTLVNVAPFIDLAHSYQTSGAPVTGAEPAFNLVASYLIDSTESVSPYALVQLSGSPKPPSLADAALEVFTKMSQTDSNRQVISQAVSHASVKQLFESLVRRLPVADADFQLVMRETWMGYVEKNLMAIYSLAFLAPPIVKQALKRDRRLGFKNVMMRLVRKFLWYPDHKNFMVAARRAVEAMKILDDGEDTFDTGPTTAPTLSFGMGYGEASESGVERGTGLLGGHRELALEMLMHRDVATDEVMFRELESLARVECA